MKKLVAALCALLIPCLTVASAETGIRGYLKGSGYEYVLFGSYPYEKDGTEAPVLWRVLAAEDGKLLMMTEQIVDTCQVIEESDPVVIEKRTYRRIADYKESDMIAYMNGAFADALTGDSPLRAAMCDFEGRGIVFPLDTSEVTVVGYGFTKQIWSEQKTRQATGTPYAVKARGLYVDAGIGKSPYWVATVKAEDGYMMQIVGYNGHLSWGAYTRVNVGVRPCVYLDDSMLSVESGAGTKGDPYVLTLADYQ